MTLALLISVPHAGTNVPEQARPYCILTPQQIVEDSDEGAGEIYDVRDCVANVSVNEPFEGGHIIRAHCREIPWMQLELSRARFLPIEEKRRRLLDALECFCTAVF